MATTAKAAVAIIATCMGPKQELMVRSGSLSQLTSTNSHRGRSGMAFYTPVMSDRSPSGSVDQKAPVLTHR